jgi:hypothetical protein
MKTRRYALYRRPSRRERFTSWLRRGRRRMPSDAWRGDPDKIRLVHEFYGWVLRWTEPTDGPARHLGHAAINRIVEAARASKGDPVAAVTIAVDAAMTPLDTLVVRRPTPTANMWVELLCSDPAPLLDAAYELFGPGGWVDQPGDAPKYVTTAAPRRQSPAGGGPA